MTLSMFIPSWRGRLALVVGFADALIVPGLIPAHGGFSVVEDALAVFLAAVTVIACLYAFRTRLIADRVTAFITAALATWLFYGLVVRELQTEMPWPNPALQPTPVGRFGSTYAVDILNSVWLSFVRSTN